MFWRNFAKFRPEKYDFDKGFFMEKKDPESPNFQEKNENRQIILMLSSSR
jgi:hypothetical protein